MGRFDWDGVNLAELYFESLEGTANPSRFTPMNDDVRARFRAAGGFDPHRTIRQPRKDAASREPSWTFAPNWRAACRKNGWARSRRVRRASRTSTWC